MENAGVCFLCSPTAIHFIQRNDSIYFKTHCGWNFQWSWCVSFLFCYYHHQSDYNPAPSDKLHFESKLKLMPCNSWWFPSATIYSTQERECWNYFLFIVCCVVCSSFYVQIEIHMSIGHQDAHTQLFVALNTRWGTWKCYVIFENEMCSIFNCRPKCFSDTLIINNLRTE